MSDRFGLAITVTGGGESPWVFTRSDGCAIEFAGDVALAAAQASALGAFDAMAPESYTPAAQPDPAAFLLALFSDSSLPIAFRLATAPWLPILQANLANPSLIAEAWGALSAQYSLTSQQQSTVSNYASACGIPGI